MEKALLKGNCSILIYSKDSHTNLSPAFPATKSLQLDKGECGGFANLVCHIYLHIAHSLLVLNEAKMRKIFVVSSAFPCVSLILRKERGEGKPIQNIGFGMSQSSQNWILYNMYRRVETAVRDDVYIQYNFIPRKRKDRIFSVYGNPSP